MGSCRNLIDGRECCLACYHDGPCDPGVAPAPTFESLEAAAGDIPTGQLAGGCIHDGDKPGCPRCEAAATGLVGAVGPGPRALELHRQLVAILCEDDQLKPERCLPLIEAYAREAVAEERERCARVADETSEPRGVAPTCDECCESIAAAIRGRGRP